MAVVRDSMLPGFTIIIPHPKIKHSMASPPSGLSLLLSEEQRGNREAERDATEDWVD